MTNLNTSTHIKLEQFRSEADTYRQLEPIRTRDLAQLQSAINAILEIARNWSLGRIEPRLRTH